MRLLRLWLVMADLRMAKWNADRHERIVERCRRALVELGVCLDGEVGIAGEDAR